MRLRLPALLLVLLLGGALSVSAQTPTQSPRSSGTATAPRPTYTIQDIRVNGVQNERTRQFVVQSSGLSEGQQITLPAGDAVAQAIRSI